MRTRLAQAGTLEIAPMETPLTLFIWSKQSRRADAMTDFSITEEAFDTGLNPIRAKVSLGMRVLSVNDLGFDAEGRQSVHDLPAAKGTARSASAARHVQATRNTGIS